MRYLLWAATGDREHLIRAKQELDHFVDHAPEECRGSMLENVQLNREIMDAWAQHGEASEKAAVPDLREPSGVDEIYASSSRLAKAPR